jgi:SAM-dependent methyltransferase
MNIFEHIYRNDLWHGGSGPGSLPSVNRPYIRFLQSFLRHNQIETVVDLGCGDWQFSRRVDWGKARYLGLDVVPHVLEANRRRYGGAAVEFNVSPADPKDIPGADLLLIKDVFQHLSNEKVHGYVNVFPKFKYVLVTNCIQKSRHLMNTDIADGGFRPVDLRLPPFARPMASVLEFGSKRIFNPWRFEFTTPGVKEVFLWIHPAAAAALPQLVGEAAVVAPSLPESSGQDPALQLGTS